MNSDYPAYRNQIYTIITLFSWKTLIGMKDYKEIMATYINDLF